MRSLLRPGRFLLAALAIALLADGRTSRADELPDCTVRNAPAYDYSRQARTTELGNTGYFPAEIAEARTRCRKDWTILVFMEADNDLEPYALWDLEEMEAGFASGRSAAGSTSRTDLLVEFDGRDRLGSRRIHVFQKPEPLRSGLTLSDFQSRTPSDIRSPILSVVPEGEGTPATRLRDFLAWGVSRYPSRHVMVIVWGHGQGFTSFSHQARGVATGAVGDDFSGRGFGGLAFDASEAKGGYLSTPQLRWALRRAILEANGGRPFDVYASDACLMQMAEVATEISDSADWIVGSAQTQVYQGLPYRRLLFEINTGRLGRGVVDGLTDTTDPARRVAELIPPLLRASLAAMGSQSGARGSRAADELSISALSTAELRERLLPALEGVADELIRWIIAPGVDTLARRLAVAAAADQALTFPGAARDLGSWLSRLEEAIREIDPSLSSESPLRREIESARLALRMTVVSVARGPAYTSTMESRGMESPAGLSAWIPSNPRERDSRLADLSRSSFFRSLSAWKSLLTALFGP